MLTTYHDKRIGNERAHDVHRPLVPEVDSKRRIPCSLFSSQAPDGKCQDDEVPYTGYAYNTVSGLKKDEGNEY